jgi:hypothetical protein
MSTTIAPAPPLRRARRQASASNRARVAVENQARPAQRWAIYIRQSKKRKNQLGQVTTVSIDLQEKACRETIALLDPSPASIKVICDHGRSGVRGSKRPGRDELLALIDAGEITAVMAYKATRIGRDIEESEHFWNRCQDRAAFVAAVDCQDLSDPLIRGVHFAMAQRESVDRSHYSVAAIDQRRSQGLVPVKSGTAYGLRWSAEELEIEPAEFPVVERIFRWFDEGATPGKIAIRLTQEGVRRRNVSHCQWDRAAIARILRCTWYIGLVPDNDTFWNADKSFLDIDLWNRCSSRISVQEDTKQQLHRPLSGLLFCAECGGWSPMSLCYSRKKRKDGSVLRRDRYRCIHRTRDPNFCPGQSVDALAVERFLLNELRASLNVGELSEARLARRQQEQTNEAEEERQRREEEITRLRDEQRELFDRRKNGEVIPDHIYNEEMSRLGAQCRERERLRDRAAAHSGMQKGAIEHLRDDLGGNPLDEARWFELSPTRRNEFLRLFFPNGVAVSKARSGKGNRVDHRLKPRTAEEADAAERRRLGKQFS